MRSTSSPGNSRPHALPRVPGSLSGRSLVGWPALAICLLFAGPAVAGTSVSGAINADTTWNLAGSPYLLTADVQVQAGVTLTIEPGVEVQVSAADGNDIELIVRGTLFAAGTSVAPIVFKAQSGEAAGSWEGLYVDSGGKATLKNLAIRHADNALEINKPLQADLDLTGVTITGFRSRAVSLLNGGTVLLDRFVIDGLALAGTTAIVAGTAVVSLENSTLRNVVDGVTVENANLGLSRVIVANTTTGVRMRVTASGARVLALDHCTLHGNGNALDLARSDSSYSLSTSITNSVFGDNQAVLKDSASVSYRTTTFSSFYRNVWWGPRLLGGDYQPTLPANATTSLRYNGLLANPAGGDYAPTDRSPARYWSPADGSSVAGAVPFVGAATGPGVHGFWYVNRTFAADTANRVAGDVVVTKGVTLNFQPGAELLFEKGDLLAGGTDINRVELRVEGTLEADGTNSRPVRLRSAQNDPAPGDWYGVLILATTEAFNIAQVDLAHAVRGVSLLANDHIVAGSVIHHCSSAGIYIEGGNPGVEQVELHTNSVGLHVTANARPDVTQVLVRSSLGIGIQVDNASLSISDSIVRDNATYGIYEVNNSGASCNIVVEHCTIAHNTLDGFGYMRSDSSYTNNISLLSSSVTHNGRYGLNDLNSVSYRRSLLTCDGSNSWGNTGGNWNNLQFQVNNCYSANPLYADAAARNYEPTVYSPNRGLGRNGTYVGAVTHKGAIGPQIEGWIWENLTLTLAGSPYTVLGDLVVTKNVTLAVEPGVVLKVVPNADGMGTGNAANRVEIVVESLGSLLTDGSGAPVKIVVDHGQPTPGMWSGLTLKDSRSSRLDNLLIEYPSYGLLVTGPGVPIIEDVTIKHHNSTGIEVRDATAAPAIDLLGVQVIGAGRGTGILFNNSLGMVRSSYVTHHQTGISVQATNSGLKPVHLVNNTIVHHTSGVQAYRSESSYDLRLYVYNNVIANSTSFAYEDRSGVSYRYVYSYHRNNNYYNLPNRQGNIYEDIGNIVTDPKIEDDDWEDFPRWWDGKLWAESLAINTGSAAAGNLPARDLINRPRTIGVSPDMGGHEFAPQENREPRADAVAKSIMVPRGEAFELDGTASVDPDGQIASAFWTMSDGTVTAGLKVQHTFANAGENQWAYITVVDDKGAEDHARVLCNVNIRPVADAGPAVFQDEGPDEDVFFDGTLSTDPDGTLVKYEWDFGDGTAKSNEKSPRHSYLSAGLYTVTLTVTDNEGLSHSDTTLATVYGNVDTVGPHIEHQEIADGQPIAQAVVVSAMIRDPSGVKSAVLQHRPKGGASKFVVMVKQAATDEWKATIPAADVVAAGVEYWITAIDEVEQGNTSTAPVGAPATAVWDFLVVGDPDPPAIVHQEIADGQEPGVAVTVTATVTDATGVAKVTLFFRPEGGAAFGAADLVRGANNLWTGQIPAFVVARPGVEYFLEASDTSPIPNTGRLPASAPSQVLDFVVGVPDHTAPVVTHTPVGDGQPAGTPVILSASATDNAGSVVSLDLYYKPAGAAGYTRAAMARGEGTSWQGQIPGAAMLVGTMAYYLIATDEAGNPGGSPLTAPAAVHTFQVAALDTTGPTITHTKVPNGQVAGKDVPVTAEATDPAGVSFMRLHYRPQGFPFFQEIPMTLANGVYSASIPAFSVVEPAVEYYLRAADARNNISTSPAGAPASFNTFTVQGVDSTGPSIVHTLVAAGQPAGVPVVLEATVTDGSGVLAVTAHYRVQGTVPFTALALVDQGDHVYRAAIPAASVLQPGVQYYLVAEDASAARNQTVLPAAGAAAPHTFGVVQPVPPPAAGELVITEVMFNPEAVLDANGEWFEVHNATDHRLELAGLRFVDDADSGFTVAGTLQVAAGDYLVFGKSDDLATNGGVLVDYAYDGAMGLANTRDTLRIVDAAGVEIDRIAYDSAAGWPNAPGAAIQLSGHLDPAVADNGLAVNWCLATDPIDPITPRDLGTPGAVNSECVAVDPCDPNPCTAPPAATCADVHTRRTYPASGTCVASDEEAVCTYTPTDTACVAPNDVCSNGECVSGLVPVGFCRLQHPLTVSTITGVMTTYYGRVYQAGITDQSTAVDVDPDLLAELGYGPDGSLPAGNVAWTWLAAAPNPGWNGSLAVPAEPDNDEYQLALAAPAPGFYDYAFRFSADGGQSWTYCDGGSAGSSDGYQVANAGALTSTPVVDPCSPNPCLAPPAARCDGDTVVQATAPGTCTAVAGQATCAYPEQRTVCAVGTICLEGACVDDPCLPNPCTAPPAIVCADDRSRRVPTSPGSCTAVSGQAECLYAETIVACGATELCLGGQCVAEVPRPGPGELVITEVLQDPAAVLDSAGEWFEVFNPTIETLELAGLSVSDDRTDSFLVDVDSLPIQPGEYLVFGRNGDPLLNGGVAVDYVYGSKMSLSNGADALVIRNPSGEVVDQILWDGGIAWPDPTGAAMQLDGAVVPDADDNDDGASWCVARTPIREGAVSDRGTPGAANPSCVVPVDFCRLQEPLLIETHPGLTTVVAGRVEVRGVTDRSKVVDPSEDLLAQLGVGPDASQPAANPAWTWQVAAPNLAYDGEAASEETLDEYRATLVAPAVGTYDYAFRFSADRGLSWKYCDASPGSADGYQVAKAGDLRVTAPVDPCDPNPCNSPPLAACEGTVAVSYASPGTCSLSGGEASCQYTATRADCAARGELCAAGRCVADPCNPNPCTAPPATTCEDGQTRRVYSSPGLCQVVDLEAECTYGHQLVACAGGEVCQAGQCLSTLQRPGPGDLVITELMIDPTAVGDLAGEWFEVYNASGVPLELAGLQVKDLGSNSFTITYASLRLDAGKYFVLGRNGDPAANGGVAVDYVYGNTMALGNSGDAVILVNPAGVEVDRVVFTTGAPWADPTGASLQLDGAFAPALVDNADGNNWCASTVAIHAGAGSDLGTPGEANHRCGAPQVDFCRLQAPLREETVPGEPFDVYGRVLLAGVTDVTPGVDPDPALLGQLGWGPAGSDPTGNGSWTWTATAPDPDWDGVLEGEPSYDEYLGELVSPASGSYAFAYRFSADGGGTWTYCDGGVNGSSDGYQPASAGVLLVAASVDPCNPNPCTDAPAADCADATTQRLFRAPGTCVASGAQAQCTYAYDDVACPAGKLCDAGICSSNLPGPRPGELVVTEILQDPKLTLDDVGEWFEVYNASSKVLELAGLKVSDLGTDSFTVAVDTLPIQPGQYLVFGRNGDTAVNGGITMAYVYGSKMSLANSDDEIVLTSALGEEIDRVAYTGAAPWAKPTGASLQFDGRLLRRGGDNALGANWCVATTPFAPPPPDRDKGTPGQANAACPAVTIPVDYCRLVGPLAVEAAPGEVIRYSGRIRQTGITEQTPGVDPDPDLLSQIGHGPDGSNPTGNAAWVWAATAADEAWDGAAAGAPTEDQVLLDLAAPGAGRYDLALRVSADAGQTWTYCDGDGSSNGYLVALAGDLHVVVPVDPCSPNPCTDPPANECVDAATLRSYPSPGVCTAVGQAAACDYPASVQPCGAGEACDAGRCASTGVLPLPGEVVITEIMYNPKAVDDSVGEWFEVRNVSDHELELAGLTVTDGTESFVIGAPLLRVPAGGFAVLGQVADPAVNGGVTLDHAYGNAMSLRNNADRVTLQHPDGRVLDTVAYGSTLPWPSPDGAALQLDSRLDPATADNEDGRSWCLATTPLREAQPTDLGTPGAANTPCGGEPRLVGWCRLQAPLELTIPPGLTYRVGGRVFVEGLTDLTKGIDPHGDLRAELGWGPDGSQPGADWTWVVAQPAEDWDGEAAGEVALDEYLGGLVAPALGRYDYAFRFSLDAALSWTYCDGGAEGSRDGYSSDQAGDLQVVAAVDPCLPNPCNQAPEPSCRGNSAITHQLPGVCEVVAGEASCTYTEIVTDCLLAGQICQEGACIDSDDEQGPTIDLTAIPTSVEEGIPFLVEVEVSDPSGVATVDLLYRSHGEGWVELLEIEGDDGLYFVEIPGEKVVQPILELYLRATDVLGNSSLAPAGGEEAPLEVDVVPAGEDLTPPTVVHTAPASVRLGDPLLLEAEVQDPSGIASVEARYRPSGRGNWTIAALVAEDGLFRLSIETGDVQADALEYYLIATDAAPAANVAHHPAGAPDEFHRVEIYTEGSDGGAPDGGVDGGAEGEGEGEGAEGEGEGAEGEGEGAEGEGEGAEGEGAEGEGEGEGEEPEGRADTGCSCRVPAAAAPGGLLWVALAAVALVAVRRRV